MSLEKTLRNDRRMEDEDIHTDVVSRGSKVVLKDIKTKRGDYLLRWWPRSRPILKNVRYPMSHRSGERL
jgi:hypothetical protein